MLYRTMRCHALSDDIEVLQMDEVELETLCLMKFK